jgi:hypothetical protein
MREVRPSVLTRPGGAAFARVGWFAAVSHLRLNRERDTNASWRLLDKALPFPYCYRFRTDNRLVKRRQRAHRRRFARSPRFLNRAGLKIVGAADDLRNTRCAETRNAFDSPLMRLNLHLR